MSNFVSINNKRIGPGEPCFITFEAGPTHDGVDTAKKLIDVAVKAGADAIKFQILDPERLMADPSMPFTYEVLVDRDSGRMETVTEPLYDILKRRALSHEEWRDLKAYSDLQGLSFFATVGFDDEIDLAADIGCHSIKIASGDVNHHPLIRAAARTGLSLQLDTGNSTLEEISIAVDVCLGEGNDKIIIHHCPSGYPAPLEGNNLNILKTLKSKFPYPIAFSDHTPGWEFTIAAVSMGADLVEKTITLDRTIRSTEHIMSLEPDQAAQFVQTIRNLEVAFGSHQRILSKEEEQGRRNVRRSPYLKNSARTGQLLGEIDIEFRRPGHGLTPDEFENYSKKRLKTDLPAHHLLQADDLE